MSAYIRFGTAALISTTNLLRALAENLRRKFSMSIFARLVDERTFSTKQRRRREGRREGEGPPTRRRRRPSDRERTAHTLVIRHRRPARNRGSHRRAPGKTKLPPSMLARTRGVASSSCTSYGRMGKRPSMRRLSFTRSVLKRYVRLPSVGWGGWRQDVQQLTDSKNRCCSSMSDTSRSFGMMRGWPRRATEGGETGDLTWLELARAIRRAFWLDWALGCGRNGRGASDNITLW